MLITAWDSLIGIRDLSSQAEPQGIRPPDVPDSIALSPDAKTLAVGLRMGGVALLDLASGQWRAMLRGQADTESVRCVRFSPDGTVLASSGVDRVIRLWDPATGKQLQSLVGHRDEVVALTFSPDGRTLASARTSRQCVCGASPPAASYWSWKAPRKSSTWHFHPTA